MSTATDLRSAPAGADGTTSVAPPSRRRRRRARAAAVVAAAVLGGGAWALTGNDGDETAGPAANDSVPTTVTTVSRRDLVDREDVQGSLGFADHRKVLAGATGTLTRIRPEGSVVRRGQSLFSIDAQPRAHVLYGRQPMYRTLSSGVGDGEDIRQLERNLVALGYDPYDAIDVDDHWDWATTAAVVRWEKDRGATRDGVVEQGDVVFTDGPARVGRRQADVGSPVQQGAPVTELTSRRRVITAQLQASRQALVHRGDRVRVTLPDGSQVGGRVIGVGRVATAGKDGAEATVDLRVSLVGRHARRSGLDQAPVTVSIATQTAKNVLTVPVTALVATGAGRYAVEVQDANGTRRLVRVQTGAFADGYVEIQGAGITAGTRVVVPR